MPQDGPDCDQNPIMCRVPWVYILTCGDGSYYVGSTWDLDQRFAQHASGQGARYTARRLPVRLAWCLETDRIDEAYGWEKRIQNWSRAKREALVCGRFDALPSLSRSAYRRATQVIQPDDEPHAVVPPVE